MPQEVIKIWVHNKIDIAHQAAAIHKDVDTHVYLSAKFGQGIDLLKEAILSSVEMNDVGENVFSARTRHLSSIQKVENYLMQALANVNQAEILAENLRLAQLELSNITGEFSADDLLGEIFGSFCIGK